MGRNHSADAERSAAAGELCEHTLQARVHCSGPKSEPTPADDDGSHTELWNAAERAHFLAHINATQEPVRFAGLVVDHGFVIEFTGLFAALAFSMWQLSSLSKWRGFSFDRAQA